MYTPKHKHSILGYARSNKNNSRLSNDIQTPDRFQHNTKSQSTNNLIYNALMSEIGEDHSIYMKKLEKECQQRKSQNHLRSKTIKTVSSSPTKEHSPDTASRIIMTPFNSIKQYDSITPKARNSASTLKHTQRFFSRNFQQYNSNPHPNIHQSQHCEVKDDKFLHFLDNYVGNLSRQSQKQSSTSQCGQEQAMIDKLNFYEYKFKQLQHFHENQLKKYHKKQKMMKTKLYQMNQQIVDLQIRLKHEHQERKRFQRLFLQYQKQLKLMKQGRQRHDLDLSYNISKDFDFSVNSELEQQFQFDNFKKFQKSSIRDRDRDREMQREKNRERELQMKRQMERESQIQMNTSQKISRFLRKPNNDVRSTKPAGSISDEEQIY